MGEWVITPPDWAPSCFAATSTRLYSHETYVKDGKIVENRQVVDNLGLLQQLGAIPQPEPVHSY
jgi:hypothetical protein